MKKFVLVLAIILCVVSIIGGKIYWNHRIQQISKTSQAASDLTAGLQLNDSSNLPIVKQIKKLPKSLQKAALKAYKTSGQVRIAWVGDHSAQTDATLLQTSLDNTFGSSFFVVTPIDLGTANSLQFNQVKTDKLFKAISGKPDAVIYMPIIYNDDHQVGTNDTATVTGYFQKKVKTSYPNAAFFAVMPNPSSQLTYMSDRIRSIEATLQKQKITTINPFSKLPKGTSLKKLLGSDGRTLSSKGQDVWTQAFAKQWGLKNKQ